MLRGCARWVPRASPTAWARRSTDACATAGCAWRRTFPRSAAYGTDPTLVTEILSELIGNSAMFTPRGGTITLAGRPRSGGLVELRSPIPGLGSQPGAQPGHRALRARLRRERLPGAGLGLGVATALAERLGGRLTLEAGPAGRARLELPAARAAPGASRTRPIRRAPFSARFQHPLHEYRPRGAEQQAPHDPPPPARLPKPRAGVERPRGLVAHRDPERQARPPRASRLLLAGGQQRARHPATAGPVAPPRAPRCRPRPPRARHG